MIFQGPDKYLDAILKRPEAYAGPSVQALEVLLLNLLNFRSVALSLDDYPVETLRKTYLSRFGHSAGAGGPASKFLETYGEYPFHEEVLGFYRAFVEAVVGENPGAWGSR